MAKDTIQLLHFQNTNSPSNQTRSLIPALTAFGLIQADVLLSTQQVLPRRRVFPRPPVSMQNPGSIGKVCVAKASLKFGFPGVQRVIVTGEARTRRFGGGRTWKTALNLGFSARLRI